MQGASLRLQVAAELARLRVRFDGFFAARGYEREEPRKVTDAKSVDPTTRFIGSHTSVLKPRLFAGTVPAGGLRIVQPCFKSQNLALYDSDQPLWNGSVFECHGLMAPLSNFDQALLDVRAFLRDTVGLGDGVRFACSPRDQDILAASYRCLDARELDLVDHENRHRFGDERLAGRDLTVTLPFRGARLHCGVLIVVELDGRPAFVEVALAPGRFLQVLHELDSYLDIFPIADLAIEDEPARRKVEDAITAAVLLIREGLAPGGSGNQRRILKAYLSFLAGATATLGLRELVRAADDYEFHQYGERTVAANLLAHLQSAAASVTMAVEA